MNLADLFEQQEKDIEKFKAMRDQAWAIINAENEQLATAFGGKELMNTDAQKLHQSRIDNFNNEWSMDGGSRYDDIITQHQKQREAITGKPEQRQEGKGQQPQASSQRDDSNDPLKQKFNDQSKSMTGEGLASNNNMATEQQQLRDKIIRQQAAIRARSREKKKRR